MDQQRKQEWLKRYMNRQLSPEELDVFFSLIRNGEIDELPAMEEVPMRYQSKPLNDLPGLLRKEKKGRIRLLTIRYVAACAAAVLLIAGGTAAYRYYAWQQLTSTFRTVSVPLGGMKRIQLEDSTVVTLTSGSVLKYPMAFNNRERRVYLQEGKAFFNVAKDQKKPFTVESGILATTALGTSFIVQRNSRYGFEKVSLYTGKVGVDRLDMPAQKRSILLSGQQFTYEKQDLEGRMGNFELSKDPLNGGTLVFRGTPFNEALYSIASYYGVNLQFDKSQFSGKLITADYNSRDVQEVLRSLSFVHHLKIIKIDHQNYSLMQQN